MQLLAEFFHERKGVARYALAFFLGAMLTLTMPPIGLFVLAPLSVCGFIWMAQTATSARRAMWLGWAYGSGFFITGLYWVSFALLVDFDNFGWVLPLSLVGGPAILAFYTYAFIPVIAYRFRSYPLVHALVFITAWASIEWIRGHALTGFPWNLPGYMWQHVLPVMQVSSLVGVYGLTLLTLLWAATPALWACRLSRMVLLGSLALAVIWGGARLISHPTNTYDAPVVRIVQANIAQTAKWDDAEQWRHIELHAELSDKNTPADAIIWPETALTSDPVLFPEIGKYISMRLPKDSVGILGTLRITNADLPIPSYHNGLYVIDSKGALRETFDKFHLVPFGEYIPFRQQLQMTPIAAGIAMVGDFAAGPGPRTLAVGGRVPPFSPLICYEVIFPGHVTDKTKRPAWLVNLTNDAWYGHTAGPYQHLEISRMRAVEEGLPLARAANTGISAMVDPLGRITASLPLGQRGAITTPLPAALSPTLYSWLGDIPFALMLLGCLGGIIWHWRLRDSDPDA